MRLRKSPASMKGAGPSPSLPLPWTDRLLRTISLVAGVAVTAYSEWQLALLVGIHPAVAPLFPVAIDTYVVASVRAGRGRDIAASLAVMGGCQVSAHLLATSSVTASIPLVAVVSLLIPVTVWRIHALTGAGRAAGVPGVPEPTVNVYRADGPPWKPVVVKAVSPALTPRSDVVTAQIDPEPEKASEGPQKPSADQVVRGLYDALGGRRPGTRHIVDALKAEGLPASDGTARSVRLRVETTEPELKALPPV
ncbi:hypothetical protein ACFYPZ_24640 [Streptomyces sp. NPDC005506]|uniref:hypothetical protein n=1 Tax=Streptomyces sp. NPDC005506 TaxID=3364718 RepID=UPI0036CFAE33